MRRPSSRPGFSPLSILLLVGSLWILGLVGLRGSSLLSASETRPGKFKFNLSPSLSAIRPSLSLSFGNYNFESSEQLDLSEFLTPLRPEMKEYTTSLGTGNILNSSDLMIPGRQIWVVTTASLPWKTGTAVNPALRAAYLLRHTPAKKVTLMVPWIESIDQKRVFGEVKCRDRKQQESHIRKWLRNDAGMGDVASNLAIKFYNGRYHPEYGSIFPVENMLALIPEEEADVAVLEEPEHLNWFHPETPQYWRARFNHVVGVMHTNYLAYTQTYTGGYYKKYVLYILNRWMVPAHCDKVIKLSGVLQRYSTYKDMVENVHGVRNEFLKIGEQSKKRSFKKNFYFIGKMLTQKGLPDLFSLMEPKMETNSSLVAGQQAALQWLNSQQSEILRAFPRPLAKDAIVFMSKAAGDVDFQSMQKYLRRTLPEGIKDLPIPRELKDLPIPRELKDIQNISRDIRDSLPNLRKDLRESLRLPKEIKESLENEPVKELLRPVRKPKDMKGIRFPIDVYGSGPDKELIERLSESRGLSENVTFFPAIDHTQLKDYKTMINPSTSEVLCTTTAEALAMGKFVICPRHESNAFFRQFPNCLMYSTPAEFRNRVNFAMEREPQPLSKYHYELLTWKGATDRFIKAARVTDTMAQLAWQDDVGAQFHTWLGKGKKGNVIRRFAGAAPLLDPRENDEDKQ
mmetsp:Transcript_17970/g.26930  ORF Transcript_17970/g.26930 Transcript_17970/m.26930 type:complete len:684 (-) Transcript_17970:297-2348(-)|eukprot:CAMPEP_0167747898 /NCGR_PEP_ID=MMETSP0110_2-20121227/4539_1 /TAXON_ID=629695 /ORGANISM="Gymnochlora sp., Strain CCMP2014" /LENGTH=683 /DNA_ID=CAMNT_0007632855 /DNA_START=139 /DNA_END=2190 /DNA_ORIENTATION=+